jgi:superfamily II DNA or RNA helicase
MPRSLTNGEKLLSGSSSRCELQFDQGTLLLSGPTAMVIEKLFPQRHWVFDPRVGAFRADAMHYSEVRQTLRRKLAARVHDSVPQWVPLNFRVRDANTAPALRPDQLTAAASWLDTRRGCVIMPTGTGKTEVALHLIAACAASTLVVAPVRDLMYQWHRRLLERFGTDAGILGDGIHRVSPLSVTTYDSAQIHMSRIGDQFSLIVFDECHHLAGPLRQDAARMCAAPFRLGLTATPERSDGRHTLLDSLIGPIVYRQSLSQARGQTLADYNVQRITIHLSDLERARYNELSNRIRQHMHQRRQSEPTFTWQQLCSDSGRDPTARRILRAFHMKAAIEDRAEEKLRVLEDLFRLHVGEPCLIFTGTNAMARDVSRRFLIPCLLSHCGKRERLDALQGLEQGRYPAVVANRVLDEGVDLPDVKVAIVIGGSSSPRQATQRLGRILRRSRYGRGTLYEIVTRETRDVIRSRRRRASDAYR